MAGSGNSESADVAEKAAAEKATKEKAAKEKAAKEAKKAKERAEAEKLKKAEKPKKKPAFYVKKGKALTTNRGIVGGIDEEDFSGDDEIKSEDLAGGQEALEAFVESGHVGKS